MSEWGKSRRYKPCDVSYLGDGRWKSPGFLATFLLSEWVDGIALPLAEAVSTRKTVSKARGRDEKFRCTQVAFEVSVEHFNGNA